MDISNLSTEQRDALLLGRERNTAWYDHEQTIIDEQTGEILQSHKETIRKTSGEPE